MKKTRNNRTWVIAAFGTALALVFAGQAGIGVAQGTATTASTVAPQPQPQPQPQKEFFRYDPRGRIDPFKPFIDPDAAKRQAVVHRALPLNPLQRLDVDQFKLVGVIKCNNQGRRAMVQDAAGKFYSLLPGSYIGMNNGRVQEILKDGVIVHEKIKTDEGKVQLRKQIMKLRQDEVTPWK